MEQKSRAVTLLELLISVVLLSVITLAVTNMELFSRFHVIAAIRRAKLQNEISFALDHMNKHITNAIGYSTNWAVLKTPGAGGDGITVRIDSNKNGKVDATDTQIVYSHLNLSTDNSEIAFYPNAGGTPEMIADKIVRDGGTVKGLEFLGNFNPATNYLEDNVLEVVIVGRWQPDQPVSSDNPEITMRSRIQMPSVSIH